MGRRVLVVGGGYVGLYSALRLQKKARIKVEVTLVSPDSFMTYQPFLPEAAAGSIEPRHVTIPLRRVLKRCRVLNGRITSLDHNNRVARLRPVDGPEYDLPYDLLVLGVGSVSRVLPVPGLAQEGIGFRTVAEAIYLRNRVLSRMDAAESTTDAAIRRRALTFTFVGGGYAGVEALAELEDLARDVSRYYPSVKREDMRWVLVEAASRILPEIADDLADYALERLRKRGIEIHLDTRLESAEGGRMRLSTGEEFESDTLVWTTGVRAHPLSASLGFPTDEQGRVLVDEFLRIKDVDDAWAAGDCAAVPDLTTGGICPPTAQHALRQARCLSANLVAHLTGRSLKRFRYGNLGQLVSLGRYKGVALIVRFKVRGVLAWFLHRTYHVLRVPTFNRKARVLADWTTALLFRRDAVQLGSLADPKDAFRRALGEE